MVLGGLVLVLVVVALLLSGGSDSNSGKAAQPGNATPTAAQPVLHRQLKALRQRLHGKNLPKPLKKQLQKQLKALEKKAGGSSKSANGGDKSFEAEENARRRRRLTALRSPGARFRRSVPRSPG